MVFKHLYEGLLGELSSVARHHREQNFIFFAKVDGGVLLPKIQESLEHRVATPALTYFDMAIALCAQADVTLYVGSRG